MPIAHVDRTQHALHLSWRRKMSGENIRVPVIGGAKDFEDLGFEGLRAGFRI